MSVSSIVSLRERLRGKYRKGEAFTIYNNVGSIYNNVGSEGCGLADFCLQFMYDDDVQVVRKALWALTKADKDGIVRLQPLYDRFVELAMSTDNSSVRRLSLVLIERLELREEGVRTDFLDFCLEHMADVKEAPAVQALCMKLAFRLCSLFPELMGEMVRTVEAMEMEYYTFAVRSVRKRILGGRLKGL